MNTFVETLSDIQPDATSESRRFAIRDWFVAAVVHGFPPVLDLALFVLVWQGIATAILALPTPVVTWKAVAASFVDPFCRNGLNDQGVGWNVLASLVRMGADFGMAVVIGIPTGSLIGRSVFLNAMASPIISLLRPMSPLAWLPISLLLFKSADPMIIWAIFICSVWPMAVNTVVGVTRVPQDRLNVACVLNLSEWRVFTRVLPPAVLPYMLTGMRLSIGTAWPVIMAVEMLTGGVGIGFWLWDEQNNLKVEHIAIAIFVIGVMGLLLEHMLLATARCFPYDAV